MAQIPTDWKTGIICSVFKKRDIGIVLKYRGISLSDADYNIFSTALLKRL